MVIRNSKVAADFVGHESDTSSVENAANVRRSSHTGVIIPDRTRRSPVRVYRSFSLMRRRGSRRSNLMLPTGFTRSIDKSWIRLGIGFCSGVSIENAFNSVHFRFHQNAQLRYVRTRATYFCLIRKTTSVLFFIRRVLIVYILFFPPATLGQSISISLIKGTPIFSRVFIFIFI